MYRFAFDLGSGSIGWAVYRLSEDGTSPVDLCDMGVRTFQTGRDPVSKASNAEGRRLPRQQRRQIDRRKKRSREVEEKLVSAGLMPAKDQIDARKEFFQIDPYCARKRAAKGPTSLHDLGRAIWHISKHRGFKSNRKTDRTNTEKVKTGKIASGIKRMNSMLSNSDMNDTYGTWLASRKEDGKTVRIRATGTDTEAFDYFPERQMLEEEFEFIWNEQKKKHSILTNKLMLCIKDSVFYQRSLKPVQPGRCTFLFTEERLPKWHPIAQEFLILQQLNNLKLLDGSHERNLSLSERDMIAAHLMEGKKMTFVQLSRKLGLSPDTAINLARGQKEDLIYNENSAKLAGTEEKPGPLYDVWLQWDRSRQIELLYLLDKSQSPSATVDALKNDFGLTDVVASEVEAISLTAKHLHICEQVAIAIVRVFRENVVVYSEAVAMASERGYFPDGVVLDHSDLRPDGDPGLSHLPPYNRTSTLRHMIGFGSGNPTDPADKRYGRISNPTVHVALGQFRRVMNKMISCYGKPRQVAIESTRDLPKSAKELNESEKYNRINRKRNEEWKAELEEEHILEPGARVGDRLLRMRLWEELGKTSADRRCPYSGRIISLERLHSDEIEIDHILPFADTFDDGVANKTVCFREMNRFKGKRSPGEAWHGDELAEIIDRVKSAPGMKNKRWRFLPTALDDWKKQRTFEDRQLHATGYLARVVRAYVEVLFPKDERSSIWMPSGFLTAMMRRRWGIFLPGHKSKNRNDHRHHAIDAAVVGAIDTRTVRMLHSYAREVGSKGTERVLPNPPPAIPNLRRIILMKAESVLTSHRPNHSSSGRLHEDTAYGSIRNIYENRNDLMLGNLVVRKPVESLTKHEIEHIRDEKIRFDLVNLTKEVAGNKKLLKERLSEWSKRSGHKRLRIIVSDGSALPIVGEDNKPNARIPYKWMIPEDIHYLDIFEDDTGKWVCHPALRWKADGNCVDDESIQPTPPGMKFIMRLHKGDTIQLLDKVSNSNTVKRVHSLQPSANRIWLAHVNEAGNLNERHKEPNEKDPFRWDLARINLLKDRRARRVKIDELGKIRTVPHGKL